jgi:hypothetical protein
MNSIQPDLFEEIKKERKKESKKVGERIIKLIK